MQFRHSTILITGGAGSIGVELAKELLKFKPHAIRIFDNNEYGLQQAKEKLTDERFRFLLGDIRERERLEMALSGVDYVYHLAAIKCIDVAAYNPTEVLATNVDGTMNLIKACLATKPNHAFLISTDKAVNPTTLYGYTKAIDERLFLWANDISDHTRFSVIRFGNVKQSRGNVFETWTKQMQQHKKLSVTDPTATRFLMDTQEATKFVAHVSIYASGGEIYVSDMEEYNIMDLAETFDLSKNGFEIIGLRPNEKLHEELMTEHEKKIAERFGEKYWVIKKREGERNDDETNNAYVV